MTIQVERKGARSAAVFLGFVFGQNRQTHYISPRVPDNHTYETGFGPTDQVREAIGEWQNKLWLVKRLFNRMENQLKDIRWYREEVVKIR